MAELRSDALVLRSRDWREADRLVTLLTRDAGKVTVLARGVKKNKSKFAALVEPLTLGRYLMHRGKSMETLIQGEIIKPYFSLHQDLLHYATAQYFCELVERSLPQNEPAGAVFTLLVAALEILEKDANPARVARCFELSLLDELGFCPALDGCFCCGQQISPAYFDFTHGATVCSQCPRSHDSILISGAAVAVMKRFLKQGFHRLSICSVSATVNTEIGRVCAGAFRTSLGLTEIKSRVFLASVEKVETVRSTI
ncbi:MAG: DNA repair protein RecO [Dethiobacter sp.]|jgi:DNA repair protein RecO (recombination protein O)|nr:DNA repair protein RecO [Dethiobacter sp.]MBS3899268.1 DNA repair protein RecO [Dethiobacter sp.]MBS3982672.1 DNA repair protein RecO [Dethiobacter sp.]